MLIFFFMWGFVKCCPWCSTSEVLQFFLADSFFMGSTYFAYWFFLLFLYKA
ncbi:hypothetical protein Pint_24008 [Pistacia integerrima]|uniref:Uncharacterized protein n=1 Tax=Pistacia integerrima TaxID=434235 RepID=A0ACC0YLF7_9ROSI|nr:hypothetical protein Pint_24008 [Pistacia integerrima]